MTAYSVGIDIGATKILVGIVREDGTVVYHLRVDTPVNEGQQVVSCVLQQLQEMQESGLWSKYAVYGVGIGTAGQIDFANGVVVSGTDNILNWKNVHLRDILSTSLGVPVWVDNDVNVHLLAESVCGIAKGKQHVVMLVLGTGVGGAALINGRLLHGTWGGASEFGHMSVDFSGLPCNCGNRGCIELYASGVGIARQFESKVDDSFEHLSRVDSKLVFALREQGFLPAVQTVDEMLDALSSCCITLAHIFNPEMLILGGGVMDQGDWLSDAVRRRMQTRGIPSLVQNVAIERAKHGSMAGLVGAGIQPFLYQ
jgi:glucokinase